MTPRQREAALRFTVACANFARLHLLQLRAARTREWMRPMLMQRTDQDSQLVATVLDEELRITIVNFLRLSRADFEHLLQLIGPMVQKTDTRLRKCIAARDKLIITLRYLATGDQYKALENAFRVSSQSIALFIPEVCDCLIKVLGEYVKVPSTQDEWKRISAEFQDKWNFPHAIGAIDGKHISIKAPPNRATGYCNNKKLFSVALLAIVDANFNFIYADVGSKGRTSDWGVFRLSNLFPKLEQDQLNIPEPEPLQETSNVRVPYLFLGAKAFPLTCYCLRPFGAAASSSGSVERSFNQCHSRARRPADMALAVLSGRFRVLQKPIELKLENARKVVLATIHLHNFIRRNSEPLRSSDAGRFHADEVNSNMSNWDAIMPRANNELMEMRLHIANYLLFN